MDEEAMTRVGGPEDPREGLEAVVGLRRTLEALEAAQVENAFVAGWSWAKIAEVLGVSKQAVHKSTPSGSGPGTLENRRGERVGALDIQPFHQQIPVGP
jgi:hypothetical protein